MGKPLNTGQNLSGSTDHHIFPQAGPETLPGWIPALSSQRCVQTYPETPFNPPEYPLLSTLFHFFVNIKGYPEVVKKNLTIFEFLFFQELAGRCGGD
jgi:hypothetical protein